MKNVRSFLELSTAHLPEQTATNMENGLFPKRPAMQGEYGFLIHVNETLLDFDSLFDGYQMCAPLRLIMAFAIDAGVDYILFDRGVESVEYFEIFDW